MYLSQQHDLLSSMPSRCSRVSPHVVEGADRAPLHPIKPASVDLKCQRPEVLSASLSASPRHWAAPGQKPLASKPPSNRDPPRHRTLMRFRYTSAHSSPPAPRPLQGVSKSRLFRSQQFQKMWDSLEIGTCETKPALPYTDLIKLCILKRSEGKLTLSQLYRDLEEKFPYFAASIKGTGWKNTLRHNLSTQPYFVKLDRDHTQPGKGYYWAYCPDLEKPSSLAQSSIVHLSALWRPPSVGATSFAPQEESTPKFCSATEFQPLTPPSPPPSGLDAECASRPLLPQYETVNLHSRQRREVSRIHVYQHADNALGPHTTHDNPYTALYPLRRLSSPARGLARASHADTGSSGTTATVGPVRTRPRPRARSATMPSSTSLPPLSSLWLWLEAEDGDDDASDCISDIDSRRTAAPTECRPKPKPKIQSLGDFYLANPILPSTAAPQARY